MDASKKKPARKAKAPDYVFEGLRKALSIQTVSKIERGMLNKAAEALVQKGLCRDNPVHRLRIQQRAERFVAHPRLRGLALTAMNLVAHWDQLGPMGTKTFQPGQPSRKEQAERDAKLKREHEAAWKWWDSLDMAVRVAKASRWPPATPKCHIVLHEFDRANRPGFKEC
jgi:hypothetical protein